MTDEFMNRQFDLRRYNCWDLVREVWLRLTGRDLGAFSMCDTSVSRLSGIAEAEQQRYMEIAEAQSPCIALFQKPGYIPHVGVYWNGRVLHIRKAGVQYTPVPVASVGFSSVRYYVPCTL
jgi:hypothetical protein